MGLSSLEQVDARSSFSERDFICGGGEKLPTRSRRQNCVSGLRKDEGYESSDRTPIFYQKMGSVQFVTSRVF